MTQEELEDYPRIAVSKGYRKHKVKKADEERIHRKHIAQKVSIQQHLAALRR
jgi:hypothetical protein